jgi:hypothetical protein
MPEAKNSFGMPHNSFGVTREKLVSQRRLWKFHRIPQNFRGILWKFQKIPSNFWGQLSPPPDLSYR